MSLGMLRVHTSLLLPANRSCPAQDIDHDGTAGHGLPVSVLIQPYNPFKPPHEASLLASRQSHAAVTNN